MDGSPSLFKASSTWNLGRRMAMLHPGEIPWLVIGVLAGAAYFALGLVLFAVIMSGALRIDSGIRQQVLALIAVMLMAPIGIFLSRGIMYGQMRANGVRLSPTQFPEAYKMVCEAAAKQGLRRVPDAYVVSGSGTINAFSAGHGFRRFVALYSDLFELGGEARDPDALRFVIAHEVGHISAGHVSYFRLLLTSPFQQFPIASLFLSRAQEYSADNFGYFTHPQGAPGTMRALSAGKYLNQAVDFDEFADRATTERGIFVILSNLASSHPILTWRAAALRDRSRAGCLFMTPSFAPAGPGSLPAGSTESVQWPTPEEALAFMEAHPNSSPSFPAPVPVGGVAPAIASQRRTTTLEHQVRAG